MPSIPAQKFLDTFREVFAEHSRIDAPALEKLTSARADIHESTEAQAADELLALIKHDLELDDFEVEPARVALAKLAGLPTTDAGLQSPTKGVSATEPAHASRFRLPPELERVLEHAVPSATARVKAYDLTFDFSKDGPTFPGTAIVSLKRSIKDPVIFEVDPERLEIKEVFSGGRSVPFELKDGRLFVTAGGGTEIDLRYTVKPTSDTQGYGLIREQYSGAMWTLTWPYYTGALFPSNSNPDDAASFKITVKVAPNRAVVGPNASAPGRFRIDEPVPAYGASFYTGAPSATTEVMSRSGVKVVANRFLATDDPERRQLLAKEAADAVDFFSTWLGAYRYGKELHFVEAPGAFSMENVGAVTLVSYANAKTAVHETAHHWFGDNVRIAHWGDLWVSEGFTEYVTLRFFEHKYGKARLYELLDGARGQIRSTLWDRSRALSNPPSTDLHETFTRFPYDMGAWMLRMLEVKLGQKSMDALMRKWYREHHATAVSTQDFVAFASRETHQELAPFFAAWNELKAIPEFADQSVIAEDGREVRVKLAVKTPLPPDTLLPLELKGKAGERQLVTIDPTRETTLTPGFAVDSLAWDPEHTVLVDVR